MARPRILPLDGTRRTITLPPDLDERLAIEAARSKTSISLVIIELIRLGIVRREESHTTGGFDPRIFPPDWNGLDLRERLVELRMHQKDLALALGLHPNTLNSWVRRVHQVPKKHLEPLKQALLAWQPSEGKFRLGSRSPR